MRRVPPAVAHLAGLLAVVGVALCLRLPNLQLVPHITDETPEVLHAYAIAFEGARPLVHTDSYNGPLWPYLLAGALAAFGPSVELGRLFALAFGIGTLVLTYTLGATIASPRRRVLAGTLAGLLVSTNPTHAIVASRVAWSNSATPFWTTLTVLALIWATRVRPGPRLIVAGLTGGLALHTHPSVAVMLLGAGVWYVAAPERRSSLSGVWPWLAAAAAPLAYLPVIAYNLLQGADSVSQALNSSNVVEPSLANWFVGTVGFAAQTGRVATGAIDLVANGPGPWPLALLGVGAVIGVAVAAVFRSDLGPARTMPAFILLTSALCLPLVNGNWTGFLEARYVLFLVPLMAAVAGALAALPAQPWAQRGALAAAVAWCALGAGQVVTQDHRALAVELDNRRLLSLVATARTFADQGYLVLVDEELRHTRWRAGGHPRRAVTYYLKLAELPHATVDLARLNHHLAEGEPVFAFLSSPVADHLGALYPGLERVASGNGPGDDDWGTYRSAALPGP